MLYLSLFFILCGAMLLLYAVITGLSEKKVSVPAGYVKKGGGEVRAFPGEELAAADVTAVNKPAAPRSPMVHLYEETDEPAPAEEKPVVQEESSIQPAEETSSAVIEEDPVAEEDLDSAGAVLYEDASRLVDYSREKGVIDPDFEHYREIRRIDEGRLVLESEGLSFHCGRKFFRFDFIKVEKLFFSRNSIAVIYGSGSPVRLFLLAEGIPFLERARQAYDEFVEQRSAGRQ